MNTKHNNLPENQLKAPYTEEGLVAAINKSGYPLQSVVATLLQPNFAIREEWSYLDKDSQETTRSTDIRADKPLYEQDKRPQLTVLPRLTLLIECKHSEHPHLFFRNVKRPDVSSFPLVAGLPHDRLSLLIVGSNVTQEIPVHTALDLFGHRFITQEVNYSFNVSRGIKESNGMKLSGEDFFRSLVLPLIKAATYLKQFIAPPKGGNYSSHACNLVIPVAVIDGPLVAVDFSAGTEITMSPWERLVRHEAAGGTFAIDVVHKSFFHEYVHSFVLPFAYDFAQTVFRHQAELYSGKGRLRPLPPAQDQPSLGYEAHTTFESRLLPF